MKIGNINFVSHLFLKATVEKELHPIDLGHSQIIIYQFAPFNYPEKWLMVRAIPHTRMVMVVY
jgi:hypothetical protein